VVGLLLLGADVVERAVEFAQLTNNGTICNAIPLRRCIWNLLDEFDFLQQFSVIPHRLSGDACVVGKFAFIELVICGEIEECVDEDRDGVMLGEIEPATRVLLSESFFLGPVSGRFATAHTCLDGVNVYRRFTP